MNKPFTVALVHEAITDDIAANVARAVERIREAKKRGAEIVCLQELFNAPYFCKSQKHERFDIAEPVPGPTVEKMRQLARELELVIIVPIFERQAAGVYRNSAAVIDADGSLRIYIQAERPSEDKLSNWLPAPKEGNFNLTMRNYMPSKEIIEQRYGPPALTRVA